MILGAIGDIRGNLPAIRSVLQIISDEGVQTLVNTGDIAVGCRWENEVIELLQHSDITSVQGGLDRMLARFLRKSPSLRDRLPEDDFTALQQAYRRCSSPAIEYLGSLPSRAKLAVDGVVVEVCHGSLTRQADGLTLGVDEALLQRQRELTAARIIVCGQGEGAFVRRVDDTLFVHPGSVGMASDGRAHFAVISTETEPWDARLRSVEYDSAQDAS